MTLPDQWQYLEELAQEIKRQGGEEHAEKLLNCATTIKDLWKDSIREIKRALAQENGTQVVGLRDAPFVDED